MYTPKMISTKFFTFAVTAASILLIPCANAGFFVYDELVSNGDFESPNFTGDAQTTTFTDWTVSGTSRGDEDDSGRVPGTNPNQVVRMGASNQGVVSMYQDLSHNWGATETYTLSLNAITVWWTTGGVLEANLLQQDNTVLWTSGAINAPEHPDTAVAAWEPSTFFTFDIDASTFSGAGVAPGSPLRLEINRTSEILWLDNVSLTNNVFIPEPSTAILAGLGLMAVCFRRRR